MNANLRICIDADSNGKCLAPDKWFEKLKSPTTIFGFSGVNNFLFYCYVLLWEAITFFFLFLLLLLDADAGAADFSMFLSRFIWNVTIRNFFHLIFFFIVEITDKHGQLDNEIHSNFSVIQLTLTVANKSQHMKTTVYLNYPFDLERIESMYSHPTWLLIRLTNGDERINEWANARARPTNSRLYYTKKKCGSKNVRWPQKHRTITNNQSILNAISITNNWIYAWFHEYCKNNCQLYTQPSEAQMKNLQFESFKKKNNRCD